jgi:cell division protein FtsZ
MEPEILETSSPSITLTPVAVTEVEPVVDVSPAPVAAPRRPQQAAGGIGQLFRKVTGGASGLMKRNLSEAPAAPPAPPAAPRVETIPEAPRPARQMQQEDIGLDIPAFLRRQAN